MLGNINISMRGVLRLREARVKWELGEEKYRIMCVPRLKIVPHLFLFLSPAELAL